MKPINLSFLVVDCKDYKPSHNWYLSTKDGYIYGIAKDPEWPDYNEARLKEFDESEHYVLMPECPGMTDEEAADEIKKWCVQNGIPFNDDMENIEMAYRGDYG